MKNGYKYSEDVKHEKSANGHNTDENVKSGHLQERSPGETTQFIVLTWKSPGPGDRFP